MKGLTPLHFNKAIKLIIPAKPRRRDRVSYEVFFLFASIYPPVYFNYVLIILEQGWAAHASWRLRRMMAGVPGSPQHARASLSQARGDVARSTSLIEEGRDFSAINSTTSFLPFLLSSTFPDLTSPLPGEIAQLRSLLTGNLTLKLRHTEIEAAAVGVVIKPPAVYVLAIRT